MMNEHDAGYRTRHEAWRMEREAKRAAWRARRAARRASRGDWSHFGDPKFWGLDAESMKQWGFSTSGCQSSGPGYQSPGSEVDDLKAKVAEMEKTIATLHQRVIVLEKLAVNDEARLAYEIEKLRREGE
jgi:hypothetical protein